MAIKTAQEEYRELYARDAIRLQQAGLGIARAAARGDATADATELFYRIVTQGMTVADLLGRRRTILEARVVRRKTPDALRDQQLFSSLDDGALAVAVVPFPEAVKEITSRTAIKAETAKEVAKVYREGRGFAIARSASLNITERVQKEFARSMTEGISTEAVIQSVGNWTRAYAEVVYRTNLNTAYTAGRFEQMMDPDISEVLGALEFNAVGDSDTRRGRPDDHGENHLAADGFLAAPNDPRWNRVSPPAGYNCRCSVRTIPKLELKRRGLITKQGTVEAVVPAGFEKFTPHPNFERSSARSIYR